MSIKRHPRVKFRLTEICKEQNLTVKALSERSGISTGCIGDLRVGRNSLPNDETLVKLCDALHVQPGELIELLPATLSHSS